MNKQRKVLITTTYNEMGIIIDTKVEEVTQTNLQPASTDTISRAKAIDLIESIETERLKGNIELIYAPAIKGLRALPPAQPAKVAIDINVGDKDTISRKAAIEEIERWLGYIDDDMVRRMQIGMKRLPPAQPERIIHCKDCEWWTKQECSPQGRCALFGMYPTGGWFCGNARRREVTT